MYEARSAEYIHIYESIALLFYFDLNTHNRYNPNRYVTLIKASSWTTISGADQVFAAMDSMIRLT